MVGAEATQGDGPLERRVRGHWLCEQLWHLDVTTGGLGLHGQPQSQSCGLGSLWPPGLAGCPVLH